MCPTLVSWINSIHTVHNRWWYSNSLIIAIFLRSLFCTQVILRHISKAYITLLNSSCLRRDWISGEQHKVILWEPGSMREKFGYCIWIEVRMGPGLNVPPQNSGAREYWLSWWWYWFFVYTLVGKVIPYHHCLKAGSESEVLPSLQGPLGFKGIFVLRHSLYRYAYYSFSTLASIWRCICILNNLAKANAPFTSYYIQTKMIYLGFPGGQKLVCVCGANFQ